MNRFDSYEMFETVINSKLYLDLQDISHFEVFHDTSDFGPITEMSLINGDKYTVKGDLAVMFSIGPQPLDNKILELLEPGVRHHISAIVTRVQTDNPSISMEDIKDSLRRLVESEKLNKVFGSPIFSIAEQT